MLFLNIKSFFCRNRVLSIAFMTLLTVSFLGGIFGINQVSCDLWQYKHFLFEKRTYVLDGGTIDASASIADYAKEYSATTESIEVAVANDDDTVVAVCYTDYATEKCACMGRSITLDEIKNGDKVVLLDIAHGEDKIGTSYSVNGNEYLVVGLSYDGNYIPYNSLQNSEVTGITLVRAAVLSEAENSSFSADLKTRFAGLKLTEPDVSGVRGFFSFSLSLLPVAVLIALSLINISFLYAFFLKMRHMQITIFRTLGATKKRIILLNICEVLLLIFVSWAIAVALYLLLSPLMYRDSAFLFTNRMQPLHYAAVLAVVALFAICMFLPTIIKHTEIDLKECVEE